ncbi:nucleotidyltransferase domain-containing protein [Candidatus Bathyarchaeota archaeon]|nr:nucleotidyltransferase domain-containing protein [Candidatus Bathyarchaeota archaeon]
MPPIRLRDRDAIVTAEGLIFRVYGYTHPPDGYICDLEYAPGTIFKSDNPKAPRLGGFYKFYEDEAWHFLREHFPKYLILHKPLGVEVIGVRHQDIFEARLPQEALRRLLEKPQEDVLIRALRKVLDATVYSLDLPIEDFGVFGSLLHGFHHPKFSDIDIIVYGRGNLERIRRLLQELYEDKNSGFYNEFRDDSPIRGKVWRYRNLNPEEFVWHQRRKLIYGVFKDPDSKRDIKVEFEPVKKWSEICNEYDEIKRITRKGWIKAILRVKDDSDAPFMPSIYPVEPIKILEGPEVSDIRQVLSYLEEYRMQAWKDETIYVEGNLEEIQTRRGSFHQITLSYGPRYYEQTIKLIRE